MANNIKNKVNVKVLQSLKVPIANGKCGSGDEIEIDTRRQICAGGEKGKLISQFHLNVNNSLKVIYKAIPDTL